MICGRMLLASSASLAVLGIAASASASELAGTTSERLANIEAQLASQAEQLEAQELRLTQQERQIARQQAELAAFHAQKNELLDELRAGRELAETDMGSSPRVAVASIASSASSTDGPVGEAPTDEAQPRVREVAAVPADMGVLTPRGTLIVDPSLEYVRSSSNRLVFRGVEIVPGIQLGVIEANDADRDSLVAQIAGRFGLTNRLEVGVNLPYIYRQDRITTVQQRDAAVSRTIRLDGHDFGDVELSARYQLNGGRGGWPIFVANGRVKPPTGKGPFDVDYDQFGVAEELATGSGFWGVEAGMTMIYPTDPAVVFASLSYLYNVPKSIDKRIGDVQVGSVDPGDSIGMTMGFGLALNPRFSVSLGYSHSYIFQTDTDLNNTVQRSNSLQVGQMQMGWSFRLSDRVTLNNNFQFGVTSDAPDMRMQVRVPYRF